MEILNAMKTLLQVNTVINTGSTGRIAEGIGNLTMENGWKSYFAYGRYGNNSRSAEIKIGNKWDNYWHVAQTRVFDKHGLASKHATRQFVNQIKKIKPDLIHLHNIHGYYLNYEILFRFLKTYNAPVVWTFHDCWPFTGHCAYFDMTGCENWKTHCGDCPCKHTYPKSWLTNGSYKNFDRKETAFTGHENLTIVTPSHWLKDLVGQSFLQAYNTRVIYNGTDLERFKPLPGLEQENNKKYILGVASTWEPRKGLKDFIRLSQLLPEDYHIVLIGVNKTQQQNLPGNITGIQRTEGIEEMVEWYNRAFVFVNPTYEDNFPTTNIEALACGTPVITYNTGGSPEAIDQKTGVVVQKGDVQDLKTKIKEITRKGKKHYRAACRERAEQHFDKTQRFQEYIELYEKVLKNN